MKSSLLAAAALCCVVHTSAAAVATWQGGFGFTPDWWTIGNNWPGGFPTPADDVVFPAGAAFIGTVQKINHTVQTMSVTVPGYGFADDGTAGAGLTVTAGITATYAGTGSTTFVTPVKAGGSQSWAMNGGRGTILWNEPVDLNGKTVTLDGTGIQEFNGTVTGAGNLIKTGTGRVAVNSAMSGGGGIAVQGGTMEFNHAAMSKTVQVSASGTVAGSGTVTSLSGSSGSVEPGTGGPGTLTVTGVFSLSGTAALRVDVNGSAPGTGYDQISAGGSVSVSGASLEVTKGGGFVPVPGTVLTILNNTGAGTVTGAFAGLPQGAVFAVGNVSFAISYTGGTGNDVTLTVLTVASSGVERVWSGAVNSEWSVPGNWAGGVVPQPGDSVQFPEVVAAKKLPHNDLAPGYPVHLVRFTAGGYTLSGAGLTLSDGIVQQAPAGASENKVTLVLSSFLNPALPAQVTRLKLQSGGALTVTPLALLLLNQPASELRLQNDQPSAVLTCGVGVTGAGFISSGGPGPVKLTVASTHTGGVMVSGAQCLAAVAGALGSGLVTVTGVLSLGDAGGAALAFSNAMKLSGTVRTTPGSGTQTWSGPVELLNGVDSYFITTGGTLAFGGVISGEGGLFLSGGSYMVFNGPASNIWSGRLDIAGITLFCNKNPGAIAIPGDVSVSGVTGALNALLAGQLAPAATLSVVERATASFGGAQTLAGLELDSGTIYTGPGLTVTGNITAAATLSPSVINGTLLTGAAPVTWQVSGPNSPGLRFAGSLGHNGGFAADITKTGAGLLQVIDIPGSSHADLQFRLIAGKLEWNDVPDVAGPFGPAIVMQGGTLNGAGRVRDITSLGGGVLSPGVGTGTLTCGSPTLRENITFLAEWTGGSGDRLAAMGRVEISNAPLFLSGSAPAYGTQWVLVDNDGTDAVVGQFFALPEDGTTSTDGALLRISYAGGDGNDVVLTRIPPPAPDVDDFDITGALPDGTDPVSAKGTGLPGFFYVLEYSSDLLTWITGDTRQADAGGDFLLNWSPPDKPCRRFFRVRAL